VQRHNREEIAQGHGRDLNGLCHGVSVGHRRPVCWQGQTSHRCLPVPRATRCLRGGGKHSVADILQSQADPREYRGPEIPSARRDCLQVKPGRRSRTRRQGPRLFHGRMARMFCGLHVSRPRPARATGTARAGPVRRESGRRAFGRWRTRRSVGLHRHACPRPRSMDGLPTIGLVNPTTVLP
jgi:hypothetical protein